MGTTTAAKNLAATLFGKTRRSVLALLFGHSDEAFYLRQISRAAGAGLGAVQRELKLLSEAGIIRRRVRGRQVYFQVNPDCPVYAELKSLVVKTAGVADVLKAALAVLEDRIRVAFIHGSIVRGEDKPDSDVDVMVVGSIPFSEVVSALAGAQSLLQREINPTVYPSQEFRTKVRSGHHFLSRVLGESKVFLIGDERELARLAQKRLAG